MPAPDSDELEEFDRLAFEAPRLSLDHAGVSLHNQFKLVIPRLTREIRRLRELVTLEGERKQLQHEKRLRDYSSDRQWPAYDQGLDKLGSPRNGKPKPEDIH